MESNISIYRQLEPKKKKTTPENVRESNEALFHATMNRPAAAEHCGMTQKEMKMTFREYLKYNEPDYDISQDAA